MGSTATTINIPDHISVWYRQVVGLRQQNVSGVPHLALAFAYAVDGEIVVQSRIESVHSFADYSPTTLKVYIDSEPNLPLETSVDPEDFDWVRDEICGIIDGLMWRSVGVEGIECLQVDVVFEMNQEWEEGEETNPEWEDVEVVEATNPTAEELFAQLRAVLYPEQERRGEEYMENDCRRRMGLVNTFVYGSARGGSPAAWMGGGEGDICAVCLEGMKVGEEVTCVPCVHRFHAACIRKWFRRSGSCPLCRFKIDDR